MSFFSRFFNLTNTGRNTDTFTQPIHVFNESDLFTRIWGNDENFQQFITMGCSEIDLYNTTPHLQVVISKGAKMLSNGEWKVVRYDNGEVIDNHPLYALLDEPNAFQDKNEFLKQLWLHYSLYGNNFTYLNYPLASSEYPRMLVNLNPNIMALQRSGKYYKQDKISNIITSYNIVDKKNSAVLDTFNPIEIMHLKRENPKDPLLGLSVLKSLHMPISNIRAGLGYVNSDYSKKGVIGFISADMKDSGGAAPLLDAQKQKLQREYSEMSYGTGDSQSKIMISNVPLKWNSVTSAIKDHAIFENEQKDFKLIIDAFGLNDSLFSFLTQSTFSNKKEGEKQAYQDCIIPFANDIANHLNMKLGTKEKGVRIVLDYSHLPALQSDKSEEANVVSTMANSLKTLVESGIDLDTAIEMVGFYK